MTNPYKLDLLVCSHVYSYISTVILYSNMTWLFSPIKDLPGCLQPVRMMFGVSSIVPNINTERVKGTCILWYSMKSTCIARAHPLASTTSTGDLIRQWRRTAEHLHVPLLFAIHVKSPSLGGRLPLFDPISLLNIHLPPKNWNLPLFLAYHFLF